MDPSLARGGSMLRLKVVRERSATYTPTRRIDTASDVYDVFRRVYEESDREVFNVVLLNGKNRVIGFNEVSVGSLTSALVHPREVFKPAILSNAAALILIHYVARHIMDVMWPSSLCSRSGVRRGRRRSPTLAGHIILGDASHLRSVGWCPLPTGSRLRDAKKPEQPGEAEAPLKELVVAYPVPACFCGNGQRSAHLCSGESSGRRITERCASVAAQGGCCNERERPLSSM
jgi:DNA repair protein RadC